MQKMPPDWNEDKKLWDTLGHIPENRPPSNFTHLVRQQLQTKSVRRSLFHIPNLFKNWTLALTSITACVLVTYLLLTTPTGSISTRPPKEMVQYQNQEIQTAQNDTVELAQLAQNYELIQDLDVIEHLNEL